MSEDDAKLDALRCSFDGESGGNEPVFFEPLFSSLYENEST